MKPLGFLRHLLIFQACSCGWPYILRAVWWGLLVGMVVRRGVAWRDHGGPQVAGPRLRVIRQAWGIREHVGALQETEAHRKAGDNVSLILKGSVVDLKYITELHYSSMWHATTHTLLLLRICSENFSTANTWVTKVPVTIATTLHDKKEKQNYCLWYCSL